MYIFLIIVALLLPILLYFLYKKTFEKKRERKKALELKKAFNHLSRKHKLSINVIDIFNNKVIGLDRKNSKLIWIEYVGNRLRQNCIALKELESHRVRKVLDKIGGCLSEVVMEFNLRDKKPAYFVFYDSAKDKVSALPYLRDKAKYWDAKIHFHVNEYDSARMFEYVL